MAVTYTNRKGVTFYLCQGMTKSGKTRYFFAREPKGEPVEQIPGGYVIREIALVEQAVRSTNENPIGGERGQKRLLTSWQITLEYDSN